MEDSLDYMYMDNYGRDDSSRNQIQNVPHVENWEDPTHTERLQFSGFIQGKPALEELLISYLNAPNVISVCKKWRDFTETKSNKIRPFEVAEMALSCDKEGTNICNIESTGIKYDNSENRVDKQLVDRPVTGIAMDVRFMCPKLLIIYCHNRPQLKTLLDGLPSWWKSSIKKTSLSFFRHNYRGQRMVFTCGFPDLHLVKLEDEHFEEAVSCVEAMPSIHQLNLTGRCVRPERVLETIRKKTDCLSLLQIPVVDSAALLIHFIKTGNFDKQVSITIKTLKVGPQGRKELEDFLQTTRYYRTETLINCIFAKFIFRDTQFILCYDNDSVAPSMLSF